MLSVELAYSVSYFHLLILSPLCLSACSFKISLHSSNDLPLNQLQSPLPSLLLLFFHSLFLALSSFPNLISLYSDLIFILLLP
jgi:hypothetical protein